MHHSVGIEAGGRPPRPRGIGIENIGRPQHPIAVVTYGEEGAVSMEAVGNNTIASAALGNVMRGRMFLNHSL